ncbi:ARM repeat-containing protein [Rickenella mellea]|uniref:ARM repeat-containing protein n=1 Tax=Rickenella mellea TaxID=50990 RepID=A0A4Y7PWV9_9AGAM|nr:ARM repeat-containing protein [Rickenella mellea]
MPGSPTKKRPAPSQAGKTAKRPHLEKTNHSRGQNSSTDQRGKRRSKPVTQVAQDESATDEEEDLEEVEDEDQEGDDGESVMNVEKPLLKDPNASRESHRVQRAVLNERKGAKPHSALLSDAKRVWALARQKNIAKEERQKHIRDLMDVVRGKVQDVVLKHDASRIVQTIVKHGSQTERDEIAGELKGHFLSLAQNKYSKFLVTKLIRSCPTHRLAILQEFSSHVMRLVLHREASSVIADAYELYANAHERALLLRDFYGKEVALFTSRTSSGSTEKQKDEIRQGFKGVMTGVDPARRKRMLVALKENLDQIFNNPDKGAISHAIVHRALWEYLTEVNHVDDETEREKMKRETFEGCQELLAEMVHTKDGSRVVREFIAQGTAKDRKQIIKVLKPHIERICKDDEAQLVLFTALDCIDDTKLTSKSLVSEVVSLADKLYNSPQGRRSLLYLLVPRSPRHFTPAQIAILAETDSAKAQTSKKDDQLRRDEIRKAASAGLISFLETKGKAEELARDTGGSLVMCETMLYADGDKSSLINALLSPLSATYPSADDTTPHIIDIPHSSRIYKTLLQGGHYSHHTKSVTRSPLFSPSAFASAWIKTVGKSATVAMAQGGGAFVVATLCERLIEEGSEEEKGELCRWFGEDVKARIRESDVKGRDVLLRSLDTLNPQS